MFATTHWGTVFAARDATDSLAHDALSRLCESYWYPLYAFLRRRGHSANDAEDLTQSFLAYLLGKDFLARVQPEHGKFRSFLLTSLTNFVADQRDRAHRHKRGGGQPAISLDAASAEQRYRLEPIEESDPERLYERRWALTILEAALRRLETEATSAGRQELFSKLKPGLVGEQTLNGYAEIGKSLGLSEGAIKVAVHRLRRRFRELFREEISHSLSEPSEIDEEIRFLFRVLCR
jgi:RNA polymerase sigma-70 factor (ECF subfamily)